MSRALLTYFARFHFPGSPRRVAVQIGLAAALATLALGLAGGNAPVARATGGVDGTVTHTSVTDFGTCTDLTGTIPAPLRTNLTLSAEEGGQLWLTPTLEDDFEGTSVDPARWISGSTYPWYQVPPSVSGGDLTLDAAYLRSQLNFQGVVPRFFEARAQLRINAHPASWPDLGFYRELPPLAYGGGPFPADSALRIFVTRDTNESFVRGRDGNGTLTDVNIPTLDLLQYHRFRLEWDATETRYYVNGVLRATIAGTATLNTWVFLYSQDPANANPNDLHSPIRVDWVRAGQYPASGLYTSCAEDAGGIVNWTSLTPTAELPTGASLAFETRTSVDGVAWSSWQAVSGSTIASPSGRYLQYRASFATSSTHVTPELSAVQVSYFGPSAVQFTPASATLDPGAIQVFNGQAVDSNGRAVTGLVSTWGLVNGGGTLGPTGVFTAGLPAGTFANTIGMTVTTIAGPVTGRATVTVRDLAPTASISGPSSVAEGSQIGLTGSGQDPNGLAVGFSWDLNNNGSFETPGSSVTFSGVDDGVYTVRLRAAETGGAGLSTVVTRTITVSNVVPGVTITGAPGAPIPEGTAVTLGQTTTDAGIADTHTYAWSVTKNGVGYVTGSGGSFTFTPDDDGTYVVTVWATDDDGGQGSDDVAINVTNVAPQVSLGPDLVLNQGQPLNVVRSFTDPSTADVFSGVVDYGAGGEALGLTPARTFTLSRPYQAVQTLTIVVTVTDDNGGVGTDDLRVTWVNISPTIQSVASTGPIVPGGFFTVTVTAGDPGGQTDPLTYWFDCDNDGVFEIGPQTSPQAVCLASGSKMSIIRIMVSDSFGATVETTMIVNASDWLFLPLVANRRSP